ncbi:hypothetical protein [Sulfoacidibacillus thermotolerans]|uniref:Uncharacterized protein n=1 Tax=Sulfoacidibacillus thermotolerans TaxID=1765684 RepID=A0A2U3D081_SULT2|nr:hypothetical protein [Sulfoacidibacillus thermotolerans]PWI54700.1 hypothetical protein BM613_13670 [Sulfoacidibacillus thermotolerans]
MKQIYCERCSDEIKSRSDLVTSFKFFMISAYHTDCFAKELKDFGGLILSATPINSISTTIILAIATIALWILSAVSRIWYIAVVALIFPLLRLSSWFIYERRVN